MHQISATPCPEDFLYAMSYNPHDNPAKWRFFQDAGKNKLRIVKQFPKSQPLNSKVRIQIQIFLDSKVHALLFRMIMLGLARRGKLIWEK